MAISHDMPFRETISWCTLAFGGATTTRIIRGPKGFFGRVVKAQAQATVSFVGTTTPAKVQVGDGVTANKFLDLFMGAAGAGTAAAGVVDTQTTPAALTGMNKTDGTPLIPNNLIQPDAQATTVTFLAATGGAPAGTADVQIVVDWFPI